MYKTFADIPLDELTRLIDLLQKKYRLPTSPAPLDEMNFRAGQCSIVQELLDERARRVREAEAKNGAMKRG